MTIPNVPPDDREFPETPDRREPSPDRPPDGPDPDVPPEYPPTQDPGMDLPGTGTDAPMRMPGENPDVETEL